MKTGFIWPETFRGDVDLSFNSISQKINFYWCHWHTWLAGEGCSESFVSFFFQPFTFFLSYLCNYLMCFQTICTYFYRGKEIGMKLIFWLFSFYLVIFEKNYKKVGINLQPYSSYNGRAFTLLALCLAKWFMFK